jgi:hypothetical protein
VEQKNDPREFIAPSFRAAVTSAGASTFRISAWATSHGSKRLEPPIAGGGRVTRFVGPRLGLVS